MNYVCITSKLGLNGQFLEVYISWRPLINANIIFFFTFIFVLSYGCQDDKVFLYHDVFFFTLGKSRILKIEKQVLYTYLKKQRVSVLSWFLKRLKSLLLPLSTPNLSFGNGLPSPCRMIENKNMLERHTAHPDMPEQPLFKSLGDKCQNNLTKKKKQNKTKENKKKKWSARR